MKTRHHERKTHGAFLFALLVEIHILTSMLNAFCSSIPKEQGAVFELDAQESFHLIKVRRARMEETVCIYDGQGTRCYGLITKADPKSACIQVEKAEFTLPNVPQLILAQVMPKGKSMDLVVQKATELGANIIQPLTSDNCEVSLAADKSRKKQEKWQSIALESIKQCGNPYLPTVRPVMSFKNFMKADAEPKQLKLIAALLPETKSPRALVTAHKEVLCCTILIGPEGDFSPTEYKMAQEKEYAPITLGPLVLRAETAGLAALSIIGNEFREAKA